MLFPCLAIHSQDFLFPFVVIVGMFLIFVYCAIRTFYLLNILLVEYLCNNCLL